MADRDRNPDTSIIGRDADAAGADQLSGHGHHRPQGTNGEGLTEQLNQTTSEDAGGNVSGTGASDACDGLDIVFEQEGDDETRH
jgi:hypothetical protein